MLSRQHDHGIYTGTLLLAYILSTIKLVNRYQITTLLNPNKQYVRQRIRFHRQQSRAG